MCDYSLERVASRPAKVGDKLITTEFPHSLTRGFADIGRLNIAVCLLPGTEIVFDAEAEYHGRLWDRFFGKRLPHKLSGTVARFRQINLKDLHVHHDALEFADGKVVLLTLLRVGQRATVLQLPAQPQSRETTGESIGSHEAAFAP
jgi:hypothetical protein